jgi:hypothetical protein
MNPIENMWIEVKKKHAGNLVWPHSEKQRCSLDLCVRRLGWSCFVSALCAISNWVHAETNEIRGWGSGILDILLKMPGLKNSPFKG